MFFWLLLFFNSLPRVLADGPDITPAGNVNAVASVSPTEFITKIYGDVFPVISLIIGIASVLYVVYAGIQYILSAGNPDKVKLARATLINAIIGIIIVVGAYFFIKIAISAGGFINGVKLN